MGTGLALLVWSIVRWDEPSLAFISSINVVVLVIGIGNPCIKQNMKRNEERVGKCSVPSSLTELKILL